MNQSIAKAGFFPRFGAYLIDMLFLGCVLSFIKFPIGLFELLYPDWIIFKSVLFNFDIFDILYFVIQLLYFTIATSVAGTTLGKALFNLAVVDEEGKKLSFFKALYRESIGKYISSVLYFGYIMIFFEPNKRGFHDYLCDTYVIYTCKGQQALLIPSGLVNRKAAPQPVGAPVAPQPMPVQRPMPVAHPAVNQPMPVSQEAPVARPMVSQPMPANQEAPVARPVVSQPMPVNQEAPVANPVVSQPVQPQSFIPMESKTTSESGNTGNIQ